MSKITSWLSCHKTLIIVAFLLAIITFLFFSVPLAVYPDSVGYFSYLKIFQGVRPLSAWDVIRGPSFPAFIFIFVSVFGSAMIGILAGAYIFLISLLSMFYITLTKIMKEVGSNILIRVFAIVLFLGLLVFNPILFGYYHALLTEFIATFFALLSCLVAWRWLKVDFLAQKAKFILYGLFFVLEFIFIWFLKQPYLTIALFPLVIACIISVIGDYKLSNVIQRCATLVICLVCLVLSIISWQSFLVANGVEYNKASSADSYYLSGGIIKGISNATLSKQYLNNIEQLKDNKFISNEEKSKIGEVLSNTSSSSKGAVRILSIQSPSGKLIDELPVFQKSDIFSVGDALITWSAVATSHPIVLLDSYLSNYITTADFYNYNVDPQTGTMTPVKKIYVYGHENHSIGLLYLYHPYNMEPWVYGDPGASGLELIKNVHNPIIETIYGKAWLLYQGAYMMFILLLPAMLIYSILRHRGLSKLKTDNHALRHVYELLIIIFGFSFLHVMFNVVLGAMIDRYAFVAIPAITLGFILLFATNKKIDDMSKDVCARYNRAANNLSIQIKNSHTNNY